MKKTGMAPTKRASFGMVTHRDGGYLFGGVTDRSGAGDKLYSELHDELYRLRNAAKVLCLTVSYHVINLLRLAEM